MQPQRILSLMALFAIGAQALPSLPRANSLTVRTDAGEAWKGVAEKRTDVDEGYLKGEPPIHEKRTDVDEGYLKGEPPIHEERTDIDEA